MTNQAFNLKQRKKPFFHQKGAVSLLASMAVFTAMATTLNIMSVSWLGYSKASQKHAAKSDFLRFAHQANTLLSSYESCIIALSDAPLQSGQPYTKLIPLYPDPKTQVNNPTLYTLSPSYTSSFNLSMANTQEGFPLKIKTFVFQSQTNSDITFQDPRRISGNANTYPLLPKVGFYGITWITQLAITTQPLKPAANAQWLQSWKQPAAAQQVTPNPYNPSSGKSLYIIEARLVIEGKIRDPFGSQAQASSIKSLLDYNPDFSESFPIALLADQSTLNNTTNIYGCSSLRSFPNNTPATPYSDPSSLGPLAYVKSTSNLLTVNQPQGFSVNTASAALSQSTVLPCTAKTAPNFSVLANTPNGTSCQTPEQIFQIACPTNTMTDQPYYYAISTTRPFLRLDCKQAPKVSYGVLQITY
jgi:hypothetical protein